MTHPATNEQWAPDQENRLRILVNDADWVRLAAFEALDEIKHQHRRNTALYVPVMLTTDKMAKLLNEAGAVNQMIFGLQDMLRVLYKKSEDRNLASPEVQRLVLNLQRAPELTADRYRMYVYGKRQLYGNGILRLHALYLCSRSLWALLE